MQAETEKSPFARAPGPRSGPFHAFLLALAASFVTACTASETSTRRASLDQCFQASDCREGLVCALGACRSECTSARDCQGGGTCITDGERGVCQSAAERDTPCDQPSDCVTPLGCASDFRCRNLCFSDDDCNVYGVTGRACVPDQRGVRFCADPQETANEQLSVAPAPGAPARSGSVGGTVATPAAGERVRASFVGPEGGTLGLGAVTLTVPAGALPVSTPLTLVEVDAPIGRVLGWAYALGPLGLELALPVQVSLSAGALAASGLSEGDVALSVLEAGRWQPLFGRARDGQAFVGRLEQLGVVALVDVRSAAEPERTDEQRGLVHNAGAACGDDADCTGTGALCTALSESTGRSYPGGYCSAPCLGHDACNLPGETRAGCPFASDRSGLSPAWCHARCAVDGDCREGYRCTTFAELYRSYGLASGVPVSSAERYCIVRPSGGTGGLVDAEDGGVAEEDAAAPDASPGLTDTCSPNPCLNGGTCTRTVGGARCDCTATGYTGATCEQAVATGCGGPNLCTLADYPCVPTADDGYTCLGQFPEWRMPDNQSPDPSVAPSYTVTADGFVLDNVTQLIWQRTLPATYAGCVAGTRCTRGEATTYCAGLGSGWRVPTKIELESIVDFTRENPAIDPTVFPGTPPDFFWTSSPYVGASGFAWLVYFDNGSATNLGPSNTYRVRCVR